MSRNTFEIYTEEELIRRMVDESQIIDYIYQKHKKYCINFMQRMSKIDQDSLLDIYQDAVIVLFEKAKSGTFSLTCSIQTYLNSICRNQVLVRLKKYSRHPIESITERDYKNNINDWFENDDSVNESRVIVIRKALTELKLNGNCYEILVRFFYNNQSMDKIAFELGYSNADNVKNQKYRCQERLKKRVFNLINKNTE